jgi:hypothetical protein
VIRRLGYVVMASVALAVAAAAVWIVVAPVRLAADDSDGSAAFPFDPASMGVAGRIAVVSTLADDGPGSLRAAVELAEPRLIVFAVGGTIDLRSNLVIREPHVTIAGETAPSPGITLKGATLGIATHHVMVRHLRVRVGDDPDGPSLHNRDGITIYGVEDGTRPVHDVVIDHCSVSWSVDEGISTWFPPLERIVIRRSIVAEALSAAGHPRGAHSMGVLIGMGSRDVTVAGNLFAHNAFRNPVIDSDAAAAVVNNLIYDHRHEAIHFYDKAEGGPSSATLVGNHAIAGPSTEVAGRMIDLSANPGSRVFLADNLYTGPDGQTGPAPVDHAAGVTLVEGPPVAPIGWQPMPGDATFDHVLATAGARPWDRDLVDRRLVEQVRTGTGSVIDSPAAVDGWAERDIATVRPLAIPATLMLGDEADKLRRRLAWLAAFAGS